MRNICFLFLFVLFVACDRPQVEVDDNFVCGVDMSWVTEQEADGVKFFDFEGNETECFELMNSVGAEAVRLRVWVDSDNDFCEVEDVVRKAQRAKCEGMDVMIDFHYSDWFADPSRQDKPKAWVDMSFDELVAEVANHTIMVLTALKNENITPRWVQIGNESRNGMLFDDGYLWKTTHDWDSYIKLNNAGYDAAKLVFPDCHVIVHIHNAWETETAEWWFSEFIRYGGKVDVIGLSHYPQTEQSLTWEEMNARCFRTIRLLKQSCNRDVMLCEIGTKASDEALATRIVKQLSDSLRTIEGCLGYFYWEPQVYGGWKPTKYNALGWNAYDMGAFTSKGSPSDIFNVW